MHGGDDTDIRSIVDREVLHRPRASFAMPPPLSGAEQLRSSDTAAAEAAGMNPSPVMTHPLQTENAGRVYATRLDTIADDGVSSRTEDSATDPPRASLSGISNPPPVDADAVAARTAAEAEASTAEADTAPSITTAAATQPMILTPSRLRIDSRVLLAHTTTQWLMNAVFAILILLKLNGPLQEVSWWSLFTPTWISTACQIGLNVAVMAYTKGMIYRQLGPPPPETASARLQMHYSFLLRARSRSHVIDAANGLVDSAAMLTVKVLFCWNLTLPMGLHTMSMRLMFTPFWVCWAVSTILNCLKDRSERVFGSTRDLLYIFLLFVACQVDGQTSFSWQVVFVVPWIWFSALFLLAWMVLTLLLFARVWARALDLILPLGFLLLLVATVPQFVSYLYLVKILDDPDNSNVSLLEILVPNAASWFAMWASSLVIAYGLRQKEKLRDMLLATGAVWTQHEQVARRMQHDQEAVRRRIEGLSEEEIAKLVDEMMEGKSKPNRLRRVGNTLYKRLQEAVQSAASDGSSPLGTELDSPAPSALTGRPSDHVTLHVQDGHAVSSPVTCPVSGTRLEMSAAASLPRSSLHAVSAVPAVAADMEGGTDATAAATAVAAMAALAAAPQGGLPLGRPPIPQLSVSQPASAPRSSSEYLSTPTSGPRSSPAQLTGARLHHRPSRSNSNTEMLPPSVTGALIRSCSGSKVVPANSPQAGADRASGSAGAGSSGGGGLLVGIVKNLGLSDEPGWSRPEAEASPDPSEAKAREAAAAAAAAAAASKDDAGDDLCIICYDQPPTCVFMECGHGGFCKKCAFLLFVRPPNECPTCRQGIEQVVELDEMTPIGEVTTVKQRKI